MHGVACCVHPSYLINTGTLTVPGPGTANLFALGFEAAGSVVLSGSGELDVGAAPVKLDNGVAVSGAGRIKLSGSQNAVPSGTVGFGAGTTLELAASSDLAGTATIGGGGTLDWTGGQIDGAITIASGTRLLVEGSATKTLASDATGPGLLTANGTSTIAGPGLLSLMYGTVTNGGTMTLGAGVLLRGSVCCVTPPKVQNNGTLIGDAGSGTATISLLAFTNSGTLDVHSGTLAINTIDPVQTKGTTLLDGGTLGSDHTLQLKKGKLVGVGMIAAAVANTSPACCPARWRRRARRASSRSRAPTRRAARARSRPT